MTTTGMKLSFNFTDSLTMKILRLRHKIHYIYHINSLPRQFYTAVHMNFSCFRIKILKTFNVIPSIYKEHITVNNCV